jgi:hypothetical protein
LKSSALQESYGIDRRQIGRVVWHSLQKGGAINRYDIKFQKKVLRNIPAKLVKAIREQKHEHAERPERALNSQDY